MNTELRDFTLSPIPGVKIEPVDSEIPIWDVIIGGPAGAPFIGGKFHDAAIWNVTFDGPEGTPFSGGKFIVNFDFTDNYPLKPPKIKFLTKIYHPGVKTDTGEIYSKSIDTNWGSTQSAKFVIEAIQALLKNPTAENAQEVSIAKVWQSNPNSWLATAKEWTLRFATTHQQTQNNKKGPTTQLDSAL